MTITLPSPVRVSATESAHHARWVEVIESLMSQTTEGYDSVQVHGWDDVPGYDDNAGERPYQHWQLAVSLTSRASKPTMSGRVGRRRWRMSALAVAPSASEVRAMRDRLNLLAFTRAPFETGSLLTPDEGDSTIDRADDIWAGGVLWTYTTDRRVEI